MMEKGWGGARASSSRAHARIVENAATEQPIAGATKTRINK